MKTLPANLQIDKWYRFEIYQALGDPRVVVAQLKNIPTMVRGDYAGCLEAKYKNRPFKNGQKLRVAVHRIKSIEAVQKDMFGALT